MCFGGYCEGAVPAQAFMLPRMIYESIDGLSIPKIGLGTWKIGGGSYADSSHDAKGLASLRSAIELGYTHFDTAEMYGSGHTEELLGQAIRQSAKPRESFIITSKVMPENLDFNGVVRSCERSLGRLGVEYLDLYLIHWPRAGVRLAETFRALNQVVRARKVRHVGVSNFDLRLLKAAEGLSETPLLTNQIPYSLHDREYAHNGVLSYCQERGILVTAYSPLDQGHFRPNKAVSTIAHTRAVTPHQVALAWLVAQPRVITIPASQNPEHQRQNLAAADIRLTPSELSELASP